MNLNLRPLVSLASAFILSVGVLAQTSSIPPGPTVLVFEGEYHLGTCPKLAGQTPKSMSLADAMRADAVNLQTAFLSPPVAMSAYYLKQVVPQWELSTIYRGMADFMVIQVIALILVILFPQIALWFPNWLFP